MKTKFILSVISAAILLLGCIKQANAGSKPAKCPSIESIQAVGLGDVLPDPYGWGLWTGTQTSNYDTNEKWEYIITFTAALDENEAREIFTNAMKTLKLLQGPVISESGSWNCSYAMQSKRIRASAFTH